MKKVRQEQLVKLLSRNGVMTVAELADVLKVSKMSIHRDLEELERQKVIKRLHGGAVLANELDTLEHFDTLMNTQWASKQEIGKLGASLVEENMIVAFDGGTTPLSVAQHISERLPFTAITLNLLTAQLLCRNTNVGIVQIGGEVYHPVYTSCGTMAVNSILKLRADLAFISTKSFDVALGTFEPLGPLVEPRKALCSIAKKVVLVVDHTKFTARSMCLSINIEQIDCVITDAKTDASFIEALRAQGKEVLVAGSRDE